MPVSRDEVMRIAGLARLRLGAASTDEGVGGRGDPVGRPTDDLNQILKYVATLEGADLSQVSEPIRLPPDPVPFRDPGLEPDVLAPGAPGDRAPRWQDGFFVVPRLPAMEGGGETGEEGKETDGGEGAS